MSDRLAWLLGIGAALVAMWLVRLLEVPVGHLDRAFALVLADHRPDPGLYTDLPGGLPDWGFIIDRVVGTILGVAIMFGSLPLASVAVLLRRSSRSRHSPMVESSRVLAFLLVAQIATLIGPALITIVGAIEGGVEYGREPLAWYFALSVVAGVLAVPIWREAMFAARVCLVELGIERRPA